MPAEIIPFDNVENIPHNTPMHTSREEILISYFDDYCHATGKEPTTVGKLAHNDSRLYKRLKEGGSCNPSTFDEVQSWFKENMPETHGRAKQ